MPVPYQSEDPRDDIARAVAAAPTMQGKIMSAIPQNPMGQFTAASMGPPTPPGGVPGSGLPAPGGSIVATPPPRMGMQGAMPSMRGAGGGGGGGMAPLGGLGSPMAMPTNMPMGPAMPQGMPPISGGVDEAGLMPPSGGVRGMGRMRRY